MIYILQRNAIRIIKGSDYYEQTSARFIKLHALKRSDLVELSTTLILYKAQNNLLLNCIQRLFEILNEEKNSEEKNFIKATDNGCKLV